MLFCQRNTRSVSAVVITQQQQGYSGYSSANTGSNGYGLERLLFHIMRGCIAGALKFALGAMLHILSLVQSAEGIVIRALGKGM